ncbi:ATP-binding protein [Romeria aff. gracilis LEGE 07310]|uniref:ATP-binding protein n=1 Tax=Vasconcelosia minhoensis LEGE 07310 TaxID=915328 RepID=A0A8J7AIS6_9CYAN|nr:ATP-binding protein [Romeria gracilis]MBE9079841.1 ATP-binding protein [Romeria aff. gracilis LEGE 07310]
MTAALPRSTTLQNWHSANQQFLCQALDQVRQALVRQGSGPDSNAHELTDAVIVKGTESSYEGQPLALDLLSRCFGLSEFERGILLLCAGMELDGAWPELCRTASGSPYPTFGLALSLFESAAWEALTPSAPLRQWQLIEVGGGNALVSSLLRIDERILHYLTGVQYLDQRLQRLMAAVRSTGLLVPSHERLIVQIEQTWTQTLGSELPVIQLIGGDSASLRTVAAETCDRLGLALQALPAAALPTDWQQLKTLKTLCEREYSLNRMAVLLSCEDLEIDAARQGAVSTWIDSLNLPLIVTSRDRRPQRQRPIVSLEVDHPTAAEQRQLWQTGLGQYSNQHVNPGTASISTLVTQFNLSPSAIRTVCLQSRTAETAQPPETLWNLCRAQARPQLDEMAQRIEARATWDSLVLPEKEQQIIQEISSHVAQRSRVYEDWGFGRQSGRGLGISALFSGASGTGKTTAAEVISRDLQLDLYRIDLSAIVSKYIGETEKNLRRIFDAAEGGGAILLFDEADALFGKRSDVNDSKDRYANMEVSYLLQRMESYRGLAILTSNLKNAMDQAFLRRLRFVVQFPFPDAKQRAEIWRRVFPADTPTEGLNCDRLAKLSIAGGNIRNIALNAAFIAASADQPVMMKHLLQAAKQEYLKLERPLTDTEVKGWV